MQSFFEKSFGELGFEILFVRRSSDMAKLLNPVLEFDATRARQFWPLTHWDSYRRAVLAAGQETAKQLIRSSNLTS
jgi:hypothetical protein